MHMKGDTDFDVVECDATDAENKIVGIDGQEQTDPDFEKADRRPSARSSRPPRYVLWIGDMMTEPGTIYCTEPSEP